MTHIAETLLTHSIEGFLRPAEIAVLHTRMTEMTESPERATFDEDRTSTMHSVPGLTDDAAMAVFEPEGRLEIIDLPDEVAAILADATSRAMPQIRLAMPSITGIRPWVYIEYSKGQHITAHVDNIAPDAATWPRQIAGISVVISPPQGGGDFYVETTGAPQLWTQTEPGEDRGYLPGMRIAHEGSDFSSAWFRDMPRTRWSVDPPAGTALIYGSQLTHGTNPVSAGVCRKFISWLIAEPS